MGKLGQRPSHLNLRDGQGQSVGVPSSEKGCSGDLLSSVFLACLNLALSC